MDVLEPGKVITPDNDLQGGSHRDNGARPKSRDQKGKKSKGEQIPNKNKDERPGQTLDSKSIQGGKKGAGKGARKDMGKLDLKDGQDSPRDCDGGKHTPNRRMKGEVGFQRDVWNGSSGQKNTHREGNGKGLRKQDGDQKGRRNNTPKNQQDRNRQQKVCFEPYLSREELQKGLKLGQIIQGPIRINPKNYEEGYIPHPDGVSDIFISGMKDRNRALNGDVVAIMLYRREDWKIHVENLKTLEEKHSDIDTSTCESVTVFQSQLTEDQNNTDSEPDVIIESEEIIDLTTDDKGDNENQSAVNVTNQSESNMIPSVSNTDRSCDNGSCDDGSAVSSAIACDINNRKQDSVSSKSVQDVSNRLNAVSLTESQSKSARQSTPKIDNKKNDKSHLKDSNRKHKNTPGPTQKKYSTVQEVMQEGSEVVKKLFKTGDGENCSVDRLLQRTGKVVAIIEPKHSRVCTGHLHLMNDKNPNTALFKPLDYRLPRIMVPMVNCPKGERS